MEILTHFCANRKGKSELNKVISKNRNLKTFKFTCEYIVTVFSQMLGIFRINSVEKIKRV